MAPHELEWWIARCSEARNSKGPVKFDWRCTIAALGLNKCYEVQIRWLQDKQYMYVMQDVSTERLHLEELERAVYDRTAKLEDALQTKSRFVAIISHELRTPLAGMMGATLLLKESLQRNQQLNDHQRELFDITDVCGEQLSALIDDVLDVTQLGQSSQTLDLSELNMYQLLRGCIEVIGFSITENKKHCIELLAYLEDPVLRTRVLGDCRRIRQVVLNILHNAVKFTAKGSITLSVKATPYPAQDKCQFIISIKDTGTGIPSVLKDKLFTPFGITYVSPSHESGGMGLGLYISRRIIDLMNGTIWYETFQEPEASGTTFYISFSLPIVSGTVSSPAIPSTSSKMTTANIAQRSPTLEQHSEPILIAEDNLSNQKILQKLLENMGWTNLAFVENGEEAVHAICETRNKYHIILMDIMMPVLNGIEATKQIRAMDLSPQPRIIALTASASPEQKDECMRAGMNDHISKPYNLKKLSSAMLSS